MPHAIVISSTAYFTRPLNAIVAAIPDILYLHIISQEGIDVYRRALPRHPRRNFIERYAALYHRCGGLAAFWPICYCSK